LSFRSEAEESAFALLVILPLSEAEGEESPHLPVPWPVLLAAA
jgi:hypothetical protein